MMKRILALLLMIGLMPACAMAQVTITDRNGNPAALVSGSYKIGIGGSPYTMTTAGVHEQAVEIQVSGGVALVLDGVQLDVKDQMALHVKTDSGSGYAALILKLAQGRINTIRSSDTDPENGLCSGMGMSVPLTIEGEGELSVQADGSAIEMYGGNHLTINGGTVKATGGWQGIRAVAGGVSVHAGSLEADSTGNTSAIAGSSYCAEDMVMLGRYDADDGWETFYGEEDYWHVRSADAVKVTYVDAEGSEMWTTKVGKGYGFEVWGATSVPEGKVLIGWKTSDGRTLELGERLTLSTDMTLEPVIVDALSVVYEQYQDRPVGDAGLIPGEEYWVNPYYGKEPAGQVFSHWLTQNGEILPVGEPVRLTRSLTLTPVFAEAVELTWVHDGRNEPDVNIIPKGNVFYARKAPDSEKGVFTGWKVSDADVTIKAHQRFIADRDLTLIAQFEKKDMVKLTFKDGNKTWAKYMPSGEENSINADGYDGEGLLYFLYWEDEAGKRYAADGLITPTKDMTLTAKYGDLSDTRISFSVLDTMTGQRSTWENEQVGTSRPAWTLASASLPDYRMRIVAPPDDRTYDEGDVLVLREEHDGETFRIYWDKLPEPIMIPGPDTNLPDTGDGSLLLLWIGLLAAGMTGLLATRARRRA